MAKPRKRKQPSPKSKRVSRDLAPRAGARVRGGAVENMVFTSVSNVLKTRHDVSKNSIDN